MRIAIIRVISNIAGRRYSQLIEPRSMTFRNVDSMLAAKFPMKSRWRSWRIGARALRLTKSGCFGATLEHLSCRAREMSFGRVAFVGSLARMEKARVGDVIRQRNMINCSALVHKPRFPAAGNI